MAPGSGKKRDFTQIAKSIIDKLTGNTMGDIIEQVKGKTPMRSICVGSF